jgi:hypothetical protein
MMSGILQIIATFSLLHYHPTSTASGYESPLCNPTYSHCRLGSIGIWAVFGSLALFFAGVISCYSSRRIAQRHRKGGICCQSVNKIHDITLADGSKAAQGEDMMYHT